MWIRKMSTKRDSTAKGAKEDLLRITVRDGQGHIEESKSGVNAVGGRNALMEGMCHNPSFRLTIAFLGQQPI